MSPSYDGDMNSSEDRAKATVRIALRVFGHGIPAALWLASPNIDFAGECPLLFAAASEEGLLRVVCTLPQCTQPTWNEFRTT